MRTLEFDISAFEDLEWWLGNNKKKLEKIFKLIKAIQRDPFKGIGKPEALKEDFSGAWSRRIDEEHRIIYQVKQDKIRILACKYHYDN